MITSAISAPPDTPPASTSPQPATTGADGMVTEQAFLQLLIAQMQNQDPTQPQDGTQFVAQLAQFSSLEQQIQMRQDLDTLAGAATAPQTGGTQATSQK